MAKQKMPNIRMNLSDMVMWANSKPIPSVLIPLPWSMTRLPVNGPTCKTVSAIPSYMFTPFDINPESSNWTSQYYGFFADDPTGHYLNLDEIIQGKGLINGMEPDPIYNTWSGIGNRTNGYTYNTSDQISVNASFAADFGNHEIQLGLQYQQRTSGFYTNNAVDLWDIMRGLTNAQLKDLDLDNPDPCLRDGEFMDTIIIPGNMYPPCSVTSISISARNSDLPVDGTRLYRYRFL